MKKFRIGIDVGGTFTHAVCIDAETLEIVSKVKIPTTHSAKEGVAKGIILALQEVLQKSSINPEDVIFIAHSTTQSTNALLEGDLEKVGIIGMGKGIEGKRAKKETNIGNLKLETGEISTSFVFLDTTKLQCEEIENAIKNLISQKCKVIVASEAFSIEDPSNELKVMEIAKKYNIPATGTCDISQLYGLRIRTKTAVINASILPKMFEVANFTEKSVKDAKINSPLMIMRSDGGVMSIEEMKKRPILTLLSGPAAGVASALMYVKVSEGIFLEVGGTSTDISVIHEGRPILKSAKIGSNNIYLKTLDVRTVGLAGGSLIRIKNNKILDVGPRSAHIAGLPYSVFSKKEEMLKNPQIITFSPKPNDPSDYVAIKTEDNKIFALTMTCAANISGYVRSEDYAYGNLESAKFAFELLAKKLNRKLEELTEEVLEVGTSKIISTISELIKDYKLKKEEIKLVGGGGGVAAVLPYVAKKLGIPYEISPDQEVISAIGVALALIREVVEKSIINPAESDIINIRREVETKLLKQGANPATIEINIEVDTKRNIVRATGVGSLEMKTKQMLKKEKTISELRKIAADSFKCEEKDVELVGETKYLKVFNYRESRKFFGLFKKEKNKIKVLDIEGIIKLSKENAEIIHSREKNLKEDLKNVFSKFSSYGDAGIIIPGIFLIFLNKIVDLSKLTNLNQIISLAEMETQGLKEEEILIIVVKN
jgi:N-methylhydantoinase A/oxoprolinase/acetone carboxylase beta subunit